MSSEADSAGHRSSTLFHFPGPLISAGADLELDLVRGRRRHCHVSPHESPIETVAHVHRITNLYLVFLNKQHAKKRQALGKSAQIVDQSMMTQDKREAGKAVELEDVTPPPAEDKGFLDTTDLKNEDFIFVY